MEDIFGFSIKERCTERYFALNHLFVVLPNNFISYLDKADMQIKKLKQSSFEFNLSTPTLLFYSAGRITASIT